MEILVVAGGRQQSWPPLTEYDFYCGIDRGAFYLLRANLPLNLAVGDFDSLSESERRLVFSTGEEILTAPAEKDDTDTQLGLATVFQRYPKANVTLIGATGGRIDHFLANLWLVFEPRFKPYIRQITVKDNQNSICYFLPGAYKIKKEAEKKYLAFCCLTAVDELTLEESKYTLSKQKVPYPTSYASNEFLTSQMKFSFLSGIIAVIQSKD